VNKEILVALVSMLGTVIGTFGGILTSSKLTSYRIEQLEKKVEKHNNLVERMAVLENTVRSHQHQIDDISERVDT